MSLNKRIITCLFLLAALGAASSIAAQTKARKFLAGYNAVVVEAVTLDKSPELAKLPAGQDTEFQKKIVDDLRRKNVFAQVIDGTKQSSEEGANANSPADVKRLILSTIIIDYKPGNKALRYAVGFGAGATKVKARFVFRDAAMGNDVWVHTQQGAFAGYITVIGIGKNHPANEASGDIIDGLIKAINRYR